jgi:hypothetical protein
VGAEASTLLRRWFDLHKRLEPAGQLLFSTLNEGRQWLENQLLNLTSFGEAYHERMHDEPRFDAELNSRLMAELLPLVPSGIPREAWCEKTGYAWRLTQRRRLQDLLERALVVVPQLEPFEEDLVRQLVATRNYLTHWTTTSKHVVDGHDMLRAVQRLIVVLEANLLLDLDLDPAAIEYAIASSYARHPVLHPAEEVQTP